MASQVERILILVKTPSAQHVETSCVAGINDAGGDAMFARRI